MPVASIPFAAFEVAMPDEKFRHKQLISLHRPRTSRTGDACCAFVGTLTGRAGANDGPGLRRVDDAAPCLNGIPGSTNLKPKSRTERQPGKASLHLPLVNLSLHGQALTLNLFAETHTPAALTTTACRIRLDKSVLLGVFWLLCGLICIVILRHASIRTDVFYQAQLYHYTSHYGLQAL